MMRQLFHRLDLPPVWGALSAALIWGWAQAVTLAPLDAAWLWPGRVLIAAGLALAVWAIVAFRRAKTPIEPRQVPAALVTAGPFRWLRNPMYRALTLILAGWALGCGEATGLAVVAAYEWLLRRRFVAAEEAVLADRFGDVFHAWAARTRRM